MNTVQVVMLTEVDFVMGEFVGTAGARVMKNPRIVKINRNQDNPSTYMFFPMIGNPKEITIEFPVMRFDPDNALLTEYGAHLAGIVPGKIIPGPGRRQ